MSPIKALDAFLINKTQVFVSEIESNGRKSYLKYIRYFLVLATINLLILYSYMAYHIIIDERGLSLKSAVLLFPLFFFIETAARRFTDLQKIERSPLDYPNTIKSKPYQRLTELGLLILGLPVSLMTAPAGALSNSTFLYLIGAFFVPVTFGVFVAYIIACNHRPQPENH